jgi:4'-phosphopantetheinyl transferase
MIRAAVCLDPLLRAHQGQHAAAERLLQHALGNGFGLPGASTGLVHDSCGRPSVAAHPEVHVSISHCDGAVLVAASSARIGVDVEWLRPLDHFALVRMLNLAEIDRVLRSPDPDREFFRYWTLKESYLKAIGTGLGYALKELDVDVAPDGTASVSRPQAWVGLEERFEGYVLAFCCLEGGPGDTDVALEHMELTRL